MRLFRCLVTASLLASTIAFAQDAQTTNQNPPNTTAPSTTTASTKTSAELKPAPQQPGTAPPKRVDYSKPVSHFPWIITPYAPRHVPDPVTVNTPRIDQVMQNGKMMLSLEDAIALALGNNL